MSTTCSEASDHDERQLPPSSSRSARSIRIGPPKQHIAAVGPRSRPTRPRQSCGAAAPLTEAFGLAGQFNQGF